MDDEKLTVVSLQAENIMRLKAVRIRPDGGPVVVISGRNAQGKSSLLESLVLALAGKREGVAKPIRRGEDSAFVEVDLGEYIVTRTYSPDGLKVTRKGGGVMPKPRALLDSWRGDLTFDPLAILSMPKQEQIEAVKQILGLDFSDLDREKEEIYEKRHDNKITQKTIKSLIDAIDIPEELSDTLVDVSALTEEMTAWHGYNAEYNSIVETFEDTRAELKSREQTIKDLEAQLDIAKTNSENISKLLTKQLKEINGISPPDTEELTVITDQINQAEEINRHVANAVRCEELIEQYNEFDKQIEEATCRLRQIEEIKVGAIEKTDIPVGGLTFDKGGLYLNGIPLDQASQKEQFEVGFALAIADNPKIGITLIRDASLLDAEALSQIAQMATAAGVQVWLERVGGEDGSFVIEDGEVIREPDGKEVSSK